MAKYSSDEAALAHAGHHVGGGVVDDRLDRALKFAVIQETLSRGGLLHGRSAVILQEHHYHLLLESLRIDAEHEQTGEGGVKDAVSLGHYAELLQYHLKGQAPVGRTGPGFSLLGQIFHQLSLVQILQRGFDYGLGIELGLGVGADEAVNLIVAHPARGVSHADEGSFLETVRAMVAGLLVVGDFWDFYGHHSPFLDLFN